MKMEERKPRPTRFGTESHEARLAVLRERAPTLGSNRKLRMYAILGSMLMILTVTAFYFAMQIYKALSESREEDAMMQVDASPPSLEESEADKALQRIEAEQAQAETDYQQQLEELKQVDLLAEPETEAP
jgi:hypothetical protein